MTTMHQLRGLARGCAVATASVVMLVAAGTASAGRITGSAHDFSTTGWAGGEICVACHTPHKADVTVSDAPLWNHELTTKTFTVYSSPTLDATVPQPDGSSKLCLSCHDGTVALDSFGGTTGTIFMTGDKAVGADELNNDHPISFTFDTALANSDGALHDPATRTVTIGSGDRTKSGTLDQVMLLAGKVQCASCHDVHNNFVNGNPLLRIRTNGSELCLACHDK